jgi:hypothetical protein
MDVTFVDDNKNKNCETMLKTGIQARMEREGRNVLLLLKAV